MKKTRKIIFAFPLLVVFLLLLELCFRIIFPSGDESWPFKVQPGPAPGENKVSFLLNEHLDTFVSPKPKGLTRIMIFGESAANGFPFVPGDGFPTWLQNMIDSAEPEHPVEILNFAVNATSSTLIAEWFGQAMAYQPDLVILYIGNNDDSSIRLCNPVNTPRLYRLLQRLNQGSRLFFGVRVLISKAVLNSQALAAERFQYLLRSERPLLAEPNRREVSALYSRNLSLMIEEAKTHGAEVVIATPGINLANWPPQKSAHYLPLSAPDADRFQRLMQEGREAAERSDLPAASESFRAALAIDPRHALAAYRLGKVLLRQGKPAEAQTYFETAAQWDDAPLRAAPRYSAGGRELASRGGVHDIDFQTELINYAQDGLPGFDLFLDAVHLNSRGNYAVARILFDKLTKWRLLPPLARDPAGFDGLADKIEVPPSVQCHAWKYMGAVCLLAPLEFEPDLTRQALVHLSRAAQACPPSPAMQLVRTMIASYLNPPDAATILSPAWKAGPEPLREAANQIFPGAVEIQTDQVLLFLPTYEDLRQALMAYVRADYLPGSLQSEKKTALPALSKATTALVWDETAGIFRDWTPFLVSLRPALAKAAPAAPIDLLIRPPATARDLKVDDGGGNLTALSDDAYLVFFTPAWDPLSLPFLCLEAEISASPPSLSNQVAIYWTGGAVKTYGESDSARLPWPSDGKKRTQYLPLGRVLKLLANMRVATLRMDFTSSPASIHLKRARLTATAEECR